MMCLFSPDSVGYHYWSGLFSIVVFWWRAQLALCIWTVNLKKYFLSIHDNLGDFNRNFRLTLASSLITQWKLNPFYSGFVISWNLTHHFPNQPVGTGRSHIAWHLGMRNVKELSLIPFCPYQQFNRAYIPIQPFPSEYSHTLEEQCSFISCKGKGPDEFRLNILIKRQKRIA